MTAALLLCAALSANMFDDTFDTANQAYLAEDYAAAVEGYERLVASSVADPVVFYNLGNAYYRSGAVAPAIANYERALHLDPGFRAARENLTVALRATKRGLQPPLPPAWEQSLLFWHYDLSYALTRGLAIVFWVLFWALLALRLWKGYPYVPHAAAVIGVLALLFAMSAYTKAHPREIAVAAAETVPVHFGTSEDETVRFELYAGDRVAVDELRNVPREDGREEQWARVVTGGGERGWAKCDDLALVGPPYVPYKAAAGAPNPQGAKP